MQKAVITSAAGAQGSAIGRAFEEAGYRVVRLVRAARPDNPGLVAVSMDDPDALARALDGADVLAFTSPIDHRPGARERLAETMARAAQRAAVGRIVVNTAAAVPDGLHRPVSDTLRTVKAAFTDSAVPTAVVEPTCYMENLSAPWAAPAIVEGVLAYPAPRHARIAWISHATLGAFAVAAAGRAIPGGRCFEIGGPEALTGDAVAERLGRAIGRPVRYEELPLATFAAAINAANGAPAGDDIADYYRHLAANPDALARDGATATELGVTAEPMAQWAARQDWPAPRG
jgi:uncharacterized protein YbjT (DUF2867 family)